jgi:hypothetical protein
VPASTHSKAAAASARTTCQQEQIAAADASALIRLTVAEAQGFPRGGRGENKRRPQPKHAEASANTTWQRFYRGFNPSRRVFHLPDLMADRYFSERQPADDCVACYGCSSLGSRNRNSGAKAAGGSCNQRNFSIETKLIENFHFFSLRYGVLLHEPDKEHSFCFEETLVNVFGTKNEPLVPVCGTIFGVSRPVLPE